MEIEMPDPQPTFELMPQLIRPVRLPNTHRADDEMIGTQGQMHHFADAFQAGPRSDIETQVW